MKKALLLALMLNGLAYANEPTSGHKPSVVVQQNLKSVISVDFQNVDIKTFFMILSKETGRKFYVDAGLSGQISLKAKDVSIDNLVKMIEKSNHLKITAYGKDFIVKKQ